MCLVDVFGFVVKFDWIVRLLGLLGRCGILAIGGVVACVCDFDDDYDMVYLQTMPELERDETLSSSSSTASSSSPVAAVWVMYCVMLCFLRIVSFAGVHIWLMFLFWVI